MKRCTVCKIIGPDCTISNKLGGWGTCIQYAYSIEYSTYGIYEYGTIYDGIRFSIQYIHTVVLSLSIIYWDHRIRMLYAVQSIGKKEKRGKEKSMY